MTLQISPNSPLGSGPAHHHPLAECPHPAAFGGAAVEPDRPASRTTGCARKCLMKHGKIIGTDGKFRGK